MKIVNLKMIAIFGAKFAPLSLWTSTKFNHSSDQYPLSVIDTSSLMTDELVD
jgi:hypothetical protein